MNLLRAIFGKSKNSEKQQISYIGSKNADYSFTPKGNTSAESLGFSTVGEHIGINNIGTKYEIHFNNLSTEYKTTSVR